MAPQISLLLACVLVGLAISAQGSEVQARKLLQGRIFKAWEQCGGTSPDASSGVSCGGPCPDAVWYRTMCTSGYTCTRLDAHYWQCRPSSSEGGSNSNSNTVIAGGEATGTGTTASIAAYQQCGGKSGDCGGNCADAAWPTPCASGSECKRSDEWYWQCMPAAGTNNGNGGGANTQPNSIEKPPKLSQAAESEYVTGMVRNRGQAVLTTAINERRQANGLPPLCTEYKLLLAANIHAAAMMEAGQVSVTGPDNMGILARAQFTGYDTTGKVEELMAATEKAAVDANGVVDSWMNDEVTKAILLSKDVRQIGSAVKWSSDPSVKYTFWSAYLAAGDNEECDYSY